MDLELIPVVMLVGGITLLYSAVRNKKPLELIRAVLQGKKLDDVPALYTPSGGGGTGLPPGAIPLADLPGTPQADGDARTDGNNRDVAPGIPKNPLFGGERQGVLPRLPGEGSGTMPPVSYRPVTPLTGNRFV